MVEYEGRWNDGKCYNAEDQRSDPVAGGLVRVPSWAASERYVLQKSGIWSLLSETHANIIRDFGGCMLLGTGQMVPHSGNGEETGK